MSSPLLAYTSSNLPQCQSFPWLVALCSSLSVSIMLIHIPTPRSHPRQGNPLMFAYISCHHAHKLHFLSNIHVVTATAPCHAQTLFSMQQQAMALRPWLLIFTHMALRPCAKHQVLCLSLASLISKQKALSPSVKPPHCIGHYTLVPLSGGEDKVAPRAIAATGCTTHVAEPHVWMLASLAPCAFPVSKALHGQVWLHPCHLVSLKSLILHLHPHQPTLHLQRAF